MLYLLVGTQRWLEKVWDDDLLSDSVGEAFFKLEPDLRVQQICVLLRPQGIWSQLPSLRVHGSTKKILRSLYTRKMFPRWTIQRGTHGQQFETAYNVQKKK